MSKHECIRVSEMLSSYIDGELSELECKKLEEHVRSCYVCAKFLDSVKFTVELSSKLEICELYQLPKEVSKKLREYLKTQCKCNDSCDRDDT